LRLPLFSTFRSLVYFSLDGDLLSSLKLIFFTKALWRIFVNSASIPSCVPGGTSHLKMEKGKKVEKSQKEAEAGNLHIRDSA